MQLKLATSLPAPASVIAKHIRLSPLNTSGTIFYFISGVPNSITAGNPMTIPIPNPYIFHINTIDYSWAS